MAHPHAPPAYQLVPPAYQLDQPAYQLAICEVHHPVLHGHDESSTPSINTHFLVYTIVDLPDFYTKAYLYEEHSLKRYVNAVHLLQDSLNTTHPSIRNYSSVTNKYIRLEIIQADVLIGNEEVAYLKTFWLRIIQRCWKKVYKARKELLLQRSTIQAVRERERTGKWPEKLRHWPLFRLNLTN